jgi:outer membrane protein assembly factor BamB
VAVPGLCAILSRADDWPQWRGPNRDGTAQGVKLPDPWPEGLKQLWQVTVGAGQASPVVVGDRVYQFARQADDEVVLCLNAQSGKELWRVAYSAPYEMHPAATSHGKGPKSTPTFHDGRLYVLGISGILSCLDAQTGREMWRKEFSKQFPTTSPLYGASMSPLVENGLVIAHVGGHDKGALTAFDAATGTVKWSNDVDGPGYASPVAATLGGERQVVTQTQNFLLGVAAANGKTLWKIPFKTDYDQNIITPVVYKDMVIYSGVSQPLTAVRLEKADAGWTTHEVWSNKDAPLYMSSPVLKGHLLFGMSHRKGGQVFCVDADTGRTLWQTEGRAGDNASLVSLGPVMAMLNHRGQLTFFKASADGYEPVKQYQVAESQTWAQPAFVGGRVYIEDNAALTCWSLVP